MQVDLSQAINMVNYYASSSEPAHVRGKTVYIQYSNRHEIVNNKSPGDVPGNDLLVIMIEGVEAGDVSIHVIHLVIAFCEFFYTKICISSLNWSLGVHSLPMFSLSVNICSRVVHHLALGLIRTSTQAFL